MSERFWAGCFRGSGFCVLGNGGWVQGVMVFLVCLMVFCAGSPSAWGAGPEVVSYPGEEQADLWFMGGQSNALGLCANRSPNYRPDPNILMYCIDRQWRVFQEPLVRYSFPHGDVSGSLDHNSGDQSEYEGRGASPAYFFARHLRKYRPKTIAFVDADTGGSMAKAWDPEAGKDNREGYYLYERMIEHLRTVGSLGKLKGAIWYQGESDVIWTPHDVARYTEVLKRFIKGFRRDTGNPELPFIIVQIGRFRTGCQPGQPGKAYKGEEFDDLYQTYTDGWDAVQDAQMKIAHELDHVWTVATVDLQSMADGIHWDWAAQERLGRRVAEVALSQVYQQPGHATPITLASVEARGEDVVVRFAGVNGRLTAPGRGRGFELRYLDVAAGTKAGAEVKVCALEAEFVEDDPAAVLLKCGVGIDFGRKPVLYYAAGSYPECNIVDEKGMAVPAFGPAKIRGVSGEI